MTMNEFLKQIASDKRKLGKELNIFMTNDLVGKGLPMYLPNGYIIWEELENYIKGKERKISTEDSKVDIYIIPTNEELMIAKETEELVKNS